MSYASGAGIFLDASHYTYNITTANAGVVLPSATGIAGRVYIIKYTASTGIGVVEAADGELIDGMVNYSLLSQYKYVKVQSTGSAWIIIGQN